MNKICKQYIADAKKFFPVMGKEERAYLKGIVNELEECIEQNNIETKQGLYEHYRQPYDVANDFYSRFETDEIVRKVTTSKYIKIAISVLIAVILIGCAVFGIFWNNNQQMALREEMVTNENYIVENTKPEATEHDVIISDDFIEDEDIIENEEIIE